MRDLAPVNSALITAGTFSATVIALKSKHPKSQDSRLVNYNAITVLLPSLLLGSKFGAILNRSVPDLVILIGAVLVLSYTAIHCFIKAKKRYDNEKIYQS